MRNFWCTCLPDTSDTSAMDGEVPKKCPGIYNIQYSKVKSSVFYCEDNSATDGESSKKC